MTDTRFALDDAIQALAKAPEVFVTLRSDNNSRLLLFAPRGEDKQTPHTQDEYYAIISGTGTFWRDGETIPFVPGDVLFVPAGVAHRFENFSADFRTWVIFAGPKVA